MSRNAISTDQNSLRIQFSSLRGLLHHLTCMACSHLVHRLRSGSSVTASCTGDDLKCDSWASCDFLTREKVLMPGEGEVPPRRKFSFSPKPCEEKSWAFNSTKRGGKSFSLSNEFTRSLNSIRLGSTPQRELGNFLQSENFPVDFHSARSPSEGAGSSPGHHSPSNQTHHHENKTK